MTDFIKDVDYALLNRDFNKVGDLFNANTTLIKSNPYFQILNYKLQKLQQLNVSEINLITPEQFSIILNEIKEKFNYSLSNSHLIDLEAQKYQLFDFVEVDDLAAVEQILFDFELSYSTFETFYKKQHFAEGEITRKVAFFETIYKLIQSPKQKNQKHFDILKELRLWKQNFIPICFEVLQNQRYLQILKKPVRKLYIMVVNQILFQIYNQPELKMGFILEILTEILKTPIVQKLINSNTKIVLLYTIAKIIFCLIETNLYEDKIYSLLELISEIVNINKVKINSIIKNWNDMYQYLILLIFDQIEEKKIDQLTKKTIQNQLKKEEIQIPFINQLWYFVCVNFTQTLVKLKVVVKKIVCHGCFSLVNLYSCRFGQYALMGKVLEELMITPFEDDVLRMKMCINLYNNEEFLKLHQLVQSLLASDDIKDHPFRQIIIDLCVVFTGIHLGKFEEGLCFARLNLEEYREENQKQKILTKDTILAHIGYSYYNIGRNSNYLQEKQNFYTKAIEYLERSQECNRNNYLTYFKLSKLYALMGKIDISLQLAKKSCNLNKGDINSLILCALLYTAKTENQKALIIIEQLIKENPNKALLYLIKGAILAEKYMSNLNKDKEYQIAEEFSIELQQFIKQKHQKSKDALNILTNLQKAVFGIAKQVPETKESFISELLRLKTLQAFDVDPLTYINYRNCIFNILDILIKIEFLDVAWQVMELIDDANSTNQIEKQFYSGLIEEKKGNYNKAIQVYEEILKRDFYHVRTMIQLALIYLQQGQDHQKQRANELLIVASKFEQTPELFLGFSYLEAQSDNLEKALVMIKNMPVIDFQIVPDRLFYNI